MKFKIGQKVKVIASTHFPTDGTKKTIGGIYKITDFKSENNVYELDNDYWYNESDLEHVLESLDDLQAGNYVLDGDKDRLKVLARVEDVVLLSWIEGYRKDWETATASVWRHIEQLKQSGYTLPNQEPEVQELTVAQIAEKLGHPVKIIKEK